MGLILLTREALDSVLRTIPIQNDATAGLEFDGTRFRSFFCRQAKRYRSS
jgi:hypothetical protein